MSEERADEEIEILTLKSQLKEVEGRLKKYQRMHLQMTNRLKELQLTDDMSVQEKFKVWMDLGGGTIDEPHIVHIKSSCGRELFEYDEPPMYCHRRQTMSIDEIADSIWDWMGEDEDKIEIAEEWMQQLMDKDIKSVCHDW